MPMPDYQNYKTFTEYLFALAAYCRECRTEFPVGSEWEGCYDEWVDVMVHIPIEVRERFPEIKEMPGWVWHVAEVDGVLLFFRLLRVVPLKIERGMPMMIWYAPSTRPPREGKKPSSYRTVIPFVLQEEPVEEGPMDQLCLFGEGGGNG